MRRHGMSYKPLLPHPRIVRTRGAVSQTALVVFWWKWVWTIEL